jgi:hypothetical protein
MLRDALLSPERLYVERPSLVNALYIYKKEPLIGLGDWQRI